MEFVLVADRCCGHSVFDALINNPVRFRDFAVPQQAAERPDKVASG
jgi:hypothetical protein